MRVAIVGQGYVGQAIGTAANKADHQVIGIENDQNRIKELANIGYQVTNDFAKVSTSEIVILAVPTPLTKNREPDLSFIESACTSIKPHLSAGTLIINESTSYPGTLRNFIAPIFGNQFHYVSAPERVDPANEKWDVVNTPRLIGGLNQTALKKASEFYRTIANQVIEVSTPEVAEAAKLFENTFRQVNIALVNEFAQIANSLGFPVHETLAAAATKPYGFMKFLPSVGVGGHCIPIDPSYLSYKAAQVGAKAKFIDLANEVNLAMPSYIASRIDNEFGLKNKTVQIAGIAYKSNVSDTRESPAIVLIHDLKNRGAHVTWHDERVKSYDGELSTEISDCDIGIVCVAHENVDYSNWENAGTKVLDLSTATNLPWPKYL